MANDIATRKPGALASWNEFESALLERQADIDAMLPSTISFSKFQATAIAAVKQNPDLLLCSTRSLMSAVTKSAQDGILPDGREGVINIYNTKVKGKNGAPDEWVKMAQWQPMTHGIRKRARELDNLIINAQVVYENDLFDRDEGDDPHIIHKPAPLGVDRGKMIGAYAIFKREGGEILHRETMSYLEIADVRSQSKDPDGLMWKKFTTEAWRKTVIRRGIKTVPVSEKLEQLVRRDDDTFNFSQPPSEPLKDGQIEMIPPRPKKSEFERVERNQEQQKQLAAASHEPEKREQKPEPKPQPQPQSQPAPAPEPERHPDPEPEVEDAEFEEPKQPEESDDLSPEEKAKWLKQMRAEAKEQTRIRDLSDLREHVADQLEGAEKTEWEEFCRNLQRELMDRTAKGRNR